MSSHAYKTVEDVQMMMLIDYSSRVYIKLIKEMILLRDLSFCSYSTITNQILY
jgi:hypothetical protein